MLIPGSNVDRIILTGLQGSGKTTVAKRMAGKLEIDKDAYRKPIDLDQRFNEMHGSINPFVEKHGMPRFRYEESEIFRHILTQTQSAVISTGGGTLIQDINRGFLQSRRDSGKYQEAVVYLEVSVEEAVRRIMADQESKENRIISGESGGLSEEEARTETLIKMLAEREKIYKEVADITVNGNQSTNDVAAEVFKKLKGLNI